jgi:two-component system CheB/CheR fusion protein
MKKVNTARLPVVKKKPAVPQALSEPSFFVAGIGASAGGLEALERFFQHMNVDSGIAFIVVSHLDPNHISIMPELIQKATRMKVHQAADGMALEPDHVYVAPANRNIAIFQQTIQLIEPPEAHGFRLPIDFFFRSLSADIHERAIGIILSGMASDGTAGIKAIKSELGMVMVQDPKSAKFDGMPSSAITTGLADYILPPEEMPGQLLTYVSRAAKGGMHEKQIDEQKIPDTFQKIFILLRNHTGYDFSQYKQNTIFRRVERRITIAQLETMSNYIRLLQEQPAELDTLFKELLIGVTNFFRDPESFENLKAVLLEVIRKKPENGHLRIWVPGCSTGEEAYSIAILLHECMDETKKYLNVQIFATDIDGKAIEKARTGLFSGIEADVSKARLNRFFTTDGNLYHIRKEIRDMLVFAPQSIIKDPPFTKLDLISCRNLLIYFNTEFQRIIIPLFHYSLMPNGILFLGSSETISGYVDLFSLADKKCKIYYRRDAVYSAQPFIEFPLSGPLGKADQTIMKQKNFKSSITPLAEKVILDNYSPTCIIIAGNGDIVYIHGRTGKYLELTHGVAKMNIFDMAREGLQHELPGLVRKAVAGKKTCVAEGVKIKSNTGISVVTLTVKPIKEPAEMQGSLLVIFEDTVSAKRSSVSKASHVDKKSASIVKDLEREIKSAKALLRSTIEELESSNEELKSTNEEMQSTNEEMQSSNEELETSKEELQSLNEELVTVNTELQNKNDELSGVNNDMKYLMDSINIPTIFLDNDLRIKRFTSHAVTIVNLIASDIGRPIAHIASNLRYANVVDDVKTVLRTLMYKEAEVQTNEGIWYQMRILPYRTISNVLDGVVITFSDINTIKTAQEKITTLNQNLLSAQEYAHNIIDTVRESLLILDDKLKVLSANRSFYKLFSTDKEHTVGKFVYELDNNNLEIPQLRVLLEQIIPKQNFFEDYEIEYNFTAGGKKVLILNARQIVHGDQETKLILLALQLKNSP